MGVSGEEEGVQGVQEGGVGLVGEGGGVHKEGILGEAGTFLFHVGTEAGVVLQLDAQVDGVPLSAVRCSCGGDSAYGG